MEPSDSSSDEGCVPKCSQFVEGSNLTSEMNGRIEQMLMVDRATSTPPPNWEHLRHEQVFDKNEYPRVNNIIKHFCREGLLSEDDALQIIRMCTYIIRTEPNVLQLNGDHVICGDLHGQFYDLYSILRAAGNPMNTQYLFLGDYVDRGCFGCETVLVLFAFKILRPHNFFLLRGNHECRRLTAHFNFKAEVLYKYSEKVYKAIMCAFDALPLAAVIDKTIFCVHGGISPDISFIEEINALERNREPDSKGPICDLLWSDPMELDTHPEDLLFTHNDLRGCSYLFSNLALRKFLVDNKLLTLIRAHEAQDTGYKLYRKRSNGFPSMICVFSAPNYCDTYGNSAAILSYGKTMKILQFKEAPHPYYLGNFQNALKYSVPLVVEKANDIARTIVESTETEETLTAKRVNERLKVLIEMTQVKESLKKQNKTKQ